VAWCVLIIIIVFLAAISTLHFAIPFIYYLFMRRAIKKETDEILPDNKYEPKTTVIVPTYNESTVITKKLQNLQKTDYNPEKLEVIVVDSASTDGTADIAKKYVKENGFPFDVLILEEEQRRGKAAALNFALKQATGEVIATSDGDSYWDESALRNGIRFMAEADIGAVTGREVLSNLNKNIYTKGEGFYREFYNALRLGESKLHSTLIFQGELSLYKKDVLEKFEDKKGSDDSGSVIDIIAKGFRCLFVPSAVFTDMAPSSWNGRMTVKTRRAQHLVYVMLKALKLKIKKRIQVPLSVVLGNFFIHIVNPFLSLVFLASLIYLFYSFPILLLLVPLPFLSMRFRAYFLSYSSSNLAAMLAVLRYLRGDYQLVWKKVPEMRPSN
jgi:biofilm PGA synthesis N-glycosyltransferase PgaC